jgi:hypothetical protein
LDHLASHISGDAFTTSNLNSPNHPINKFLNVTTESFHEPETHQTSPMITEPEQVPPLTTIPEQEPLENISEIPQENLTAEPNSEPENTQPQATNQPQIAEQSPIIVETLNNDTPLSSDPSSPSSEQPTQVYGPVYKPLTYGVLEQSGSDMNL